MTKKISNFKNGIIAIILIAMTLFVSGMILLTKGNKIFAYYMQDYTGLSNQNFLNASGSDKPQTPTSWNLTKTLPSNVKAGVISLNEKTFLENNENYYYLPSVIPKYSGISSQDSNVLMINARTGKANIGYKSNSFTLNSNAYYKISVYAYSQNDSNAYGTIALSSNGITNTVNSLNVLTLGSWQEYSIYVKTNETQALNDCTLDLWLGSNSATEQAGATGAVLYDNITITEYAQSSYNADLKNNSSSNKLEIDLQNEKLDIITNSDFENNNLTGWSVKTNNGSNPLSENNVNGVYLVNYSEKDYVENILKVDSAPTSGNFINNTKALLINNTKSAESIGYESTPFALDNNSVYKISVYAKSSISEGTAQIVLKENKYKENDSKYDKYNSNLQTFNVNLGTSTNAKTNNWIEYSFYVSTKTFDSIMEDDFKYTFTLGLWVGTESSPAKGYAFFDNISVCKIATSDIPSSLTNATVCDLVADSTTTIKNGTFNNVTVPSKQDTYPLTPENWTLTSSDDTSYRILNGVINVNEDNFNSFKTTIQNKVNSSKLSSNALNVINPVKSTAKASDNVLMIGNLTPNYQYFESDSFSLSSSSYYELSVDVNTELLNNATAGIQLLNDKNIVAEKVNIATDSNWKTYKFFIKTGSDSTSATLKLSLGKENATGQGFAFFDNVTLKTINEQEYNTPSTTYDYKKVNLVNEDFSNISEDKDIKNRYTPYSWTFSSNITNIDDVKKGVIKDVNKLSDYDLPKDANSNNLLAIESINSDGYFLYKSNKEYTISSNSYYEISIWIKTNSINHEENEEKGEYGASFFVSNSNNSFNGFKGINTNNEWKKYSIYVNSTDATNYYINLALGNSENNARGNVYYSTLIVNSIDEDTYYENIKPLEEDESIDNIIAIGNTDKADTDTDDSTTDDNNDSGFKFDFTLVASIITALAILIALIGVGVRKINFKKPVKVGKKDYDRELLVEKTKQQQEKITVKENELNSLKEQLSSIQDKVNNLKDEYKNNINKLDDNYKQELLNLDINNSEDTDKLKAECKEKNRLAKQDLLNKYNDERKDLMEQYENIESQIEVLYHEELELIREYKIYSKQAKAKKRK